MASVLGGLSAVRPWYEAIPSVTAEVACSGGEHAMSWERGSLVVHEHDFDAERAMAALGGEVPECIQIVEAWEQSLQGPDCAFIVRDIAMGRAGGPMLGPHFSSGHGAAISAVQAVTVSMLRGAPPTASAGTARGWRSPLDRLRFQSLLLGLPVELRDRYVLTAAQGSKLDAIDGIAERILQSKALPLIGMSAEVWRRTMRWFKDVDCALAGDGKPAMMDGEANKGIIEVAARLPLSWLWTVWGRGIALVEGVFTLEVLAEEDEDLLRVRAARWERLPDGRSVPVTGRATLIRCGDSWGAVWED